MASVPQDYAKAREWFEKAAAAGNVGAMTNLGFLYEKGWGVPQDYVKARDWYEKAAAGGDAGGMIISETSIGMGKACRKTTPRRANGTKRPPPAAIQTQC